MSYNNENPDPEFLVQFAEKVADPPYGGWAEGGDTPTLADFCPVCDELVEHFNPHAGEEPWRGPTTRWHTECWYTAHGYEKIEPEPESETDDGQKYPNNMEGYCSNCRGLYAYRLDRPNPLPDKGGRVMLTECSECFNYWVDWVDVEDEPLTEADRQFIERMEHAGHWFSDVAKLMDIDDFKQLIECPNCGDEATYEDGRTPCCGEVDAREVSL